MLRQLKVTNIALIEQASIDFDEGLTVLTGETGAGKTALLSALKLLVGERADTSCVRDGATKAIAEAVFDVDGREFVVKRQVSVDGRSRCWIDGAAVNVSDLAMRIGPMMDLHGQHEHQSLLQPATHVAYLDAWIGEKAAVARQAYVSAFDSHAQARAEYDALVRASRASKHDLDIARFDLAQIEAVSPYEGEYEALEAQIPPLQHADALGEAARSASYLLHGEEGATEKMAKAASLLAKEADIDPALAELAERLDEVCAQGEDLAADLRSYHDTLDLDPGVLESKLERLSTLDGLCKRYGPRIEDVFAREKEAKSILRLIDSSEELIETARIRLEDAEVSLTQAAEDLARIRFDGSDAFTTMLSRAARELAMDSCSFVLALSDLPRQAWTAEGSQHIELLYSPGGTVTPRPLVRIASGGELSRVMLAIVGEIDLNHSADTLVFDEVDVGIGGATAIKVADRVRQLASHKQVIAVTHLAQMASVANRQFVVRKSFSGTMPVTVVQPVEEEERVEEIARMLAGDISEASVAHAREMLA